MECIAWREHAVHYTKWFQKTKIKLQLEPETLNMNVVFGI